MNPQRQWEAIVITTVIKVYDILSREDMYYTTNTLSCPCLLEYVHVSVCLGVFALLFLHNNMY